MPAGALPKWGCKSLPSAHGGMLLPGLYFVFGDMISWYLTPNKGDKLLPTVKGFTASSLFLLVKPAPSLVGSTLLAPVLLWVDFKEAGTKNKRETDGLVYLHICDTFDNPNDHATSTSCCFTTATSPAASADVHPCSHLGFAAGPCCLASRIQWRCGWVSMKKNPGLFTLLHLPFAKLFGEFSVKALAELHWRQFFAAFYIFWTGFASHTHTHITPNELWVVVNSRRKYLILTYHLIRDCGTWKHLISWDNLTIRCQQCALDDKSLNDSNICRWGVEVARLWVKS